MYKPAKLDMVMFETEDVIVTSNTVPIMTSATTTVIRIPTVTSVLTVTTLD